MADYHGQGKTAQINGVFLMLQDFDKAITLDRRIAL